MTFGSSKSADQLLALDNILNPETWASLYFVDRFKNDNNNLGWEKLQIKQNRQGNYLSSEKLNGVHPYSRFEPY